MGPLQVKLVYPTSLLVQLPKGCNEYYIKVKGERGSYTTKGNAAQHQSWVELVLNPSRQKELDDLRQEKKKTKSRSRKDTWFSSGQRYQKINIKIASQKTYGKFK